MYLLIVVKQVSNKGFLCNKYSRSYLWFIACLLPYNKTAAPLELLTTHYWAEHSKNLNSLVQSQMYDVAEVNT